MASMFCCLLFVTVLLLTESDIGVRKSIIKLTENEKQTILNALYEMKKNPSRFDDNYNAYDYFGVAHKFSTDPLKTYGHCQWSFLPWHRAMLYLFEKEIQFYANDQNIHLPYWDLSTESGHQVALFDETFLGGNGNASAGWLLNQEHYSLNCDKFPIPDPTVNAINTQNHTCLERHFGEGRIAPDNRTYGFSLPNGSEWDAILDKEYLNYDTYPYNSVFMNYSQYNTSFRAILEGCDPSWQIQKEQFIPRGACMFLHGGVHVYISGQLGSAASPLDPLFFMLHNWIDLMWAKFQDKYGDDTFPMEYASQSLFEIADTTIFGGEIWTSLDVLDHRRKLNYVYDVQMATDTSRNDWIWYLGFGIIVVVIMVLLPPVWYYCRKRRKKNSIVYIEM